MNEEAESTVLASLPKSVQSIDKLNQSYFSVISIVLLEGYRVQSILGTVDSCTCTKGDQAISAVLRVLPDFHPKIAHLTL